MIDAPAIWSAPLMLLLAACGPRPQPGTTVEMDFTREGGFFTAPVPGLDLIDETGHPSLRHFPGRLEVEFLSVAFDLIEDDVDGAGITSAIYFRTSGPLDPESLPDAAASLEPDSPIFLIDVDPDSPGHLQRIPVDVQFRAEGSGPYGTTNQLSLLPLQGRPLRPHTRYAAVVLRDLLDAGGERLGVSETLADLASGRQPPGLGDGPFEGFRGALESLKDADIRRRDLAGLAVFRTAEPRAQARAVREHALAHHLPVLDSAPVLTEVFDEFCTFTTTVEMPDYQEGTAPYLSEGGRWHFDEAGAPILQRLAPATVWITVPRQVQPAGGFPLVVFVRTGGGGDRPVIDRGTAGEPFGDPLLPGSGPALNFARAGFAAFSVDGPHGGLRNPTGGDEQVLIFNVLNPMALRENIRQSAIELSLVPELLDGWSFDASACPEVGSESQALRFDLERLALMGHSTGATISPLVLSLQPRYRAAILSGAGASYIANVMYKRSPLDVKAAAELFMGYEAGQLYEHEPILSVVQWAADSADPLAYTRELVREPRTGEPPRHLLMLQGIIDTYILPPIANAASSSLGLDSGGPLLDETLPELAEFRGLGEVLPFGPGERISLPATGNVDGAATAVVVQHREDFVRDGHEIVFQHDAPKLQYQCFLETFRKHGVPTVPALGGSCPP